MHIEAKKTTVFVIHLSLGEALAALQDPAPLQKEIRALLRNPGPHHAAKKKSPKAAASATCEYCGKKFLARGLKKHERTCPQRPDA